MLDETRFAPREYAALTWVREFLTNPDGVPAEIEQRFVATFTPREQLDIKASMKGMYFFNLLANTQLHLLRRLTGRPDEEDHLVCEI